MFCEWYQKKKTEDTNQVTLFVSSVLFVFWYHSPKILDTLHICNISWLRVNSPSLIRWFPVSIHPNTISLFQLVMSLLSLENLIKRCSNSV
jgi:hypothetical protein